MTSSARPLLLERDGTIARFDLGEYACLRSCLRESLTEGWSAGSGHWTEAAALFHALPAVSARAATWDPGSGLVALKGRGRWAPVEALAMLMWAAPIYRAAVRFAQAQPWAGEEWLPRLTAPPAQVRRLGSRLDDLAGDPGRTPIEGLDSFTHSQPGTLRAHQARRTVEIGTDWARV